MSVYDHVQVTVSEVREQQSYERMDAMDWKQEGDHQRKAHDHPLHERDIFGVRIIVCVQLPLHGGAHRCIHTVENVVRLPRGNFQMALGIRRIARILAQIRQRVGPDKVVRVVIDAVVIILVETRHTMPPDNFPGLPHRPMLHKTRNKLSWLQRGVAPQMLSPIHTFLDAAEGKPFRQWAAINQAMIAGQAVAHASRGNFDKAKNRAKSAFFYFHERNVKQKEMALKLKRLKEEVDEFRGLVKLYQDSLDNVTEVHRKTCKEFGNQCNRNAEYVLRIQRLTEELLKQYAIAKQLRKSLKNARSNARASKKESSSIIDAMKTTIEGLEAETTKLRRDLGIRSAALETLQEMHSILTDNYDKALRSVSKSVNQQRTLERNSKFVGAL